MLTQQQTYVTNQQDALRPLRNFVNLLGGIVNDQSYAGQDGYAVNQPYQYQTVGAYGVAVEGSPISTTPSGGVAVSNSVVMLAIGAAVVYFLVK